MMLSRDPEVLLVITDVVHWGAVSRYTENHFEDSVTCAYADLFRWTEICRWCIFRWMREVWIWKGITF